MQNYKKYQDYTLEFTEGLTGIIGRNGSGKSTIFDAITFALYGDVRGEKDTLRYAKADAKEAVIVTLEFEIDAKSYRVVREMRGKTLVAKAHLYDGDDVLIAESAKGVTSQVIKLIGMNKEAFMHTVFASQKELTALSGLKNEERKKIIRKLLGLEKIDKIEQEIKSKLTQLNRDIKSFSEILLLDEEVKELEEQKEVKEKEAKALQKEIEKILKNFETKSQEVFKLEKTLKAMQVLKDEFLKLESDLCVMQTNLDNLNNNKKDKKEKLEVLKQSKVKYEKEKHLILEYTTLQKSIDALHREQVKHERKKALEKEQENLRVQYKKAELERDDLKKKLEIKPQLVKEIEDQNKLFLALKDKIKEFESKENKLKEEIAKYKGLIEENNNKVANIEAIGKGSNCPTCTRPLLEEYDKVITSLNDTIAKLHNDEILKRQAELKKVEEAKTKEQDSKDNIDAKLKKLSGDLRVLEEDEKALIIKENEFIRVRDKGLSNKQELEALKDVKYDEKTHAEVNSKRDTLKPKYEELLGVEKLIAQIPTLENELKDIERSITHTKESIQKQENAIKEHSYDAKVHTTQTEIYDKARAEKDTINENLTREKIEQQKISGEINTLKSRLSRNEEQKRQLQVKLDDKNDYEKLKAFMGEFKNKINSQISPRISQLASEMYGSITTGKYQHIEVSNEFDFFIYDDGIKYPIERFSGGEVDLANLVLRIAISKTLSELSGSGGVGFLAFDEVFGSQDEERRFEIMEAFHTIKEQYRQIFLISHESEIKEMFERVVEL
jgi:exonuclease SbcC